MALDYTPLFFRLILKPHCNPSWQCVKKWQKLFVIKKRSCVIIWCLATSLSLTRFWKSTVRSILLIIIIIINIIIIIILSLLLFFNNSTRNVFSLKSMSSLYGGWLKAKGNREIRCAQTGWTSEDRVKSSFLPCPPIAFFAHPKHSRAIMALGWRTLIPPFSSSSKACHAG